MVDLAHQTPVGVIDTVTFVLLCIERGLICLDNARKQFGDLFGGLDVPRERHRSLHRRLTRGEAWGAVDGGSGAFGQSVPAADDLRRVIQRKFTEGGELLLQRGGDHRLVHGEHENLVVGEQAVLDGVAEREVVELRAVAQFVIHRHQLGGMLVGLVLDASL